MTLINRIVSTALVSICATGTALAQENDIAFTASLGAGAEYDSNVGVPELDRSTDEGDAAATLNGALAAEWSPVKRLTLKGGYDFSSKTWSENGAFDQQIHRLHADAAWDFDIVEAGTSYNHATALLDGDEFLTLKQAGIYAGKLIDNRYYLRLSADRREKTFEDATARDATADILGADMFVFFNEARSFVSVGASSEKEDAESDPFDYQGAEVKAKISNKFDLAGLSSKLSIGARHEKRDYDNVTPEIEAIREDTRSALEMALDTSLTKNIALTGKYEYADNSSNLPAADYSENVVSAGLKLSF